MSFLGFYLWIIAFDLLLVLVAFGVLIPFVPPFTQLKIHTKRSHVFAFIILSLVPAANFIAGAGAVLMGLLYFVIEGTILLNDKPLYKIGDARIKDTSIPKGQTIKTYVSTRGKF